MRVKIDHEFRVDGKIFTVADLVEYEQQNVRQGTELTFPLIGLMHYAPSDEQWTNRWGQTWNIPQLVREEIRESVRGAACGGVHRLMALSYVVRKRLQRREPLDGEYLRAKQHVDDYLQLAYQLQNPDGSYSTNWFEGRGADPDIDQRLLTTGHTLEWMVYAVREDALQHREIVRAANYLAELMVQRPAEPWEIGPRSHALRTLALYDERVFGGAYGQRAGLFADVVEEHGDQRLTRSAAVKLPNQVSEETDSSPRTRFRRRFGR